MYCVSACLSATMFLSIVIMPIVHDRLYTVFCAIDHIDSENVPMSRNPAYVAIEFSQQCRPEAAAGESSHQQASFSALRKFLWHCLYSTCKACCTYIPLMQGTVPFITVQSDLTLSVCLAVEDVPMQVNPAYESQPCL